MFNLSKYEKLYPLASLRRQAKKPSIPYRYSYGLLFVQLDILRYGEFGRHYKTKDGGEQELRP